MNNPELHARWLIENNPGTPIRGARWRGWTIYEEVDYLTRVRTFFADHEWLAGRLIVTDDAERASRCELLEQILVEIDMAEGFANRWSTFGLHAPPDPEEVRKVMACESTRGIEGPSPLRALGPFLKARTEIVKVTGIDQNGDEVTETVQLTKAADDCDHDGTDKLLSWDPSRCGWVVTCHGCSETTFEKWSELSLPELRDRAIASSIQPLPEGWKPGDLEAAVCSVLPDLRRNKAPVPLWTHPLLQSFEIWPVHIHADGHVLKAGLAWNARIELNDAVYARTFGQTPESAVENATKLILDGLSEHGFVEPDEPPAKGGVVEFVGSVRHIGTGDMPERGRS